MSRYSAIDSNIVLRVILDDNDAQRQRALSLLLNGGEYYVDDVVVMEAVYVMVKEGRARDFIVNALRTFLTNPMIHYNRDLFDQVFPVYATHPSLSFDDCCLQFRVQDKGCLELWTFDRKFARQSEIAKELK